MSLIIRPASTCESRCVFLLMYPLQTAVPFDQSERRSLSVHSHFKLARGPLQQPWWRVTRLPSIYDRGLILLDCPPRLRPSCVRERLPPAGSVRRACQDGSAARCASSARTPRCAKLSNRRLPDTKCSSGRRSLCNVGEGARSSAAVRSGPTHRMQSLRCVGGDSRAGSVPCGELPACKATSVF